MNIYIAILILAVSTTFDALFFISRLNSLKYRLEAQDAVITELKQEQMEIHHQLDEERDKRRCEDDSIRYNTDNIMSGRVYCRTTEE